MKDNLTLLHFCKNRTGYMAEITKMWIADKMREIMKHKPMDKIRVTEICREADIEGRPFTTISRTSMTWWPGCSARMPMVQI